MPDGRGVARGEDEISDALSELLERPMHLAEHVSGGDRYMDTSGHHDFAPLHILSMRTLARMRALAPGSTWDARRFRPNLVLDDHAICEGVGDVELLGRRLRGASGMELYVGLPTPRCVVTTRPQAELLADAAILKTIAATNRWSLGPFGRPACLGVYGEVQRAGALHLDETLTLSAPVVSAEAAVAATVQRVAAHL